ncbi:MAG: DUF1573 domain-containing protein [Bacteroidales bacterium]|nr:DUF1573 domain-containing protein [Bacteroidales bacterium]
MKNLFFMAAFAIMMMISASASAQWTDLFGSGNSNQKAELSTNKAAAVKWDMTEYEFGEIPQDQPKTVEFTFTNTGDKPVFITNAEASCGCTKLEYVKAPILPGKTGKISTVFDAKEAGVFSKSVTVYLSLDAPNNVFELKFNGTVVKK